MRPSHGNDFPHVFHLPGNEAATIHWLVKISSILATLSLLAVFSTSCNTTIGLGRDLRLLGEGMETSAQKTRSGGEDPGAPVY